MGVYTEVGAAVWRPSKPSLPVYRIRSNLMAARAVGFEIPIALRNSRVSVYLRYCICSRQFLAQTRDPRRRGNRVRYPRVS